MGLKRIFSRNVVARYVKTIFIWNSKMVEIKNTPPLFDIVELLQDLFLYR